MSSSILSKLKKAQNLSAFFSYSCLATLGLFNNSVVAYADTPASVKAVIDGDTLLMKDRRMVRLIGINCPERGRNGGQDQPFSLEAKLLLQELINDQPVRLIAGKQPRDSYGRFLAKVILADGRDAQEQMLKRGYCSVVAIPPNVSTIDLYLAAQSSAQRKGVGIWAHPYFAPIEAHSLTKKQIGFRFVSGKITAISASRKKKYLNMGRHFAFSVSHWNWKRFWHGKPQDLIGKTVTVSGWLTSTKYGLRMNVEHPAMLNLQASAGSQNQPRALDLFAGGKKYPMISKVAANFLNFPLTSNSCTYSVHPTETLRL